MMDPAQIETVTRDELIDELSAAGEYTEDHDFLGTEEVRQLVRDVVAKYSA